MVQKKSQYILGKNMKNVTVVFTFQKNEIEGTYYSRQVNIVLFVD